MWSRKKGRRTVVVVVVCLCFCVQQRNHRHRDFAAICSAWRVTLIIHQRPFISGDVESVLPSGESLLLYSILATRENV